MRSLSIFIGLALIATAIYYKPIEPSLACSTGGSCAFIKGKYMIELARGNVTKYNTETGEWTRKFMKSVK